MDTKTEILWRQYAQFVELYKFYMDLILKLNVFYYAVTGAIFSFFFSNLNGVPNLKYSLLFPLIMSFAFSGVFIYGAILMKYLRNEVFSIRDSLSLNVAPDLGVLSVMLYVFSAVFCLVAVGCIYLLCCYDFQGTVSQ